METLFSHPLAATAIAVLLLMGIGGKLFGFSFKRIAKWFLYAAVFAVIIVMTSIFFPFIGGKDWFFRFAIELASACVLLWWGFEARAGEFKKELKAAFKKPLVIAVTVFVVVFLLACIFAYDAHAAFWSNFERGEGGFQMIHYYLFFMLLSLLFTEEKDWKTLFKCSLAAAGGMILYGTGGNFSSLSPHLSKFIGPYTQGTAPTSFWHLLIDGRFQGSLGNPAYVDPYLIFSMFYAGMLWLWTKMEGRLKAWMSWGYGVLIAVLFFFFLLGQTRGAFLGLGVGVLAFLVYLIFSSRGAVRKWGAVILCLLVLVGVGLYSVRNTKFVQSLPEGRLLQISLSDATAQTRFWVWGEAWKGFLERPILGWGPENFPTVFDKFFNPNFFVPGQNAETWFDRAHSVYFDYLSETGILGLLAYLGIFGTFAWALFAQHRRRGSAEHAEAGHRFSLDLSNVERGLMLALPVAYLVQGVAIFDVLPMYLNVFLFLAFASYYFSAKSTAHAGHENHGE